jgi:hypothetical protein
MHFTASSSGHLTFKSESITDSYDFPSGLNLTYYFPPIAQGSLTIRFEFAVNDGASGRVFVLVMNGRTLPSIVDDRVIVNGVESSVLRVFLGQETGANGDGDFSDGLCLICCSEAAAVIAYPCRHCCMCRACSQTFARLSNHCPVCRATVLELIDCGSVDGNC